METISEKYERLRPQLQDGDIIIYHGTSLVSKIIRWSDNNAYYCHIGVVIKKHNALFTVDAEARGVNATRLSYRVKSYSKHSDFMIIRPLLNREDINRAMATLLQRSDDKTIKYDFDNGLKEMFNRKFKSIFKIKETPNEAICSSNVSGYAKTLQIVTEEFNKLRIAFPQDYIRYLALNNVKTIN